MSSLFGEWFNCIDLCTFPLVSGQGHAFPVFRTLFLDVWNLQTLYSTIETYLIILLVWLNQREKRKPQNVKDVVELNQERLKTQVKICWTTKAQFTSNIDFVKFPIIYIVWCIQKRKVLTQQKGKSKTKKNVEYPFWAKRVHIYKFNFWTFFFFWSTQFLD